MAAMKPKIFSTTTAQVPARCASPWRSRFRRRRAGKPMVTVDFTGSSPQVAGSINAVDAITFSACFYVFRCLLQEDVPAAAGLMRPVRMIAPRNGRECATARRGGRRQR